MSKLNEICHTVFKGWTRSVKSHGPRSYQALERDRGVKLFGQQHYLEINQARLAHLSTLELPLHGKTVLDVGAGRGDLAQFFVERACKVVCIDGRQENIDELHSRYPDLPGYVADVQNEPLGRFGTFDVVFCYGLLYHLENPLSALRNIHAVCKELLLIETAVCDHHLPVFQLVDEPLSVTQALQGLGCRPSSGFVIRALSRVGFPFIYVPKIPPAHPHFHFKRKNNLDWRRNGSLLRNIFIASRSNLTTPTLISALDR